MMGAPHPELAAFLDLVAAAGNPPMHEVGIAQARADYDAATPMLDAPGDPRVLAQDFAVPARDGARLPARLYRPGAAGGSDLPLLLFLHGGGYCLGGLESHDSLCRDLAALAPCAVLALDYRRAPEHRFPTAYLDALDAWTWLLGPDAPLGWRPGRLAVGGDSVGGSLAAALSLHARDAGGVAPLLQLLLYPCTSASNDFPSKQRYATGYLLEAATLDWMFANALSRPEDADDWRFAPLAHPDLRGVAPAHIALAECDLLVDEGTAYARRLQQAGVATRLDIYPGMVHDFARLGNIVEQTAVLRADLARALAAAFKQAADGA